MAASLCEYAVVFGRILRPKKQREIREGAPPNAGDTQKKGRLTIQCDELWSFVDNKGNKQWIWLALDADTREIVGVYIGARDEAAAGKLWESLPPVYPRVFGGKFPPETLDANARLHTLTFGQPMGQCYRANVSERSAKKQARLATSS